MEPMNTAADVFAWSIAGGLLMLVMVELRHWMKTGSSKIRAPRPHRIPADEMRLLGEDYRAHTDAYFRKWSKRKAIVKEVCDVDS